VFSLTIIPSLFAYALSPSDPFKMHHAWLCGYKQMAAHCDVTLILHLLWCIWVDKMHYLVKNTHTHTLTSIMLSCNHDDMKYDCDL